ncbi:MAG: flagellar basal body-associated FliL family protein [Nitrospinae bacterium]|nr:flagellar basal body-associated FliL family protein [Nitrospinota bacterium]
MQQNPKPPADPLKPRWPWEVVRTRKPNFDPANPLRYSHNLRLALSVLALAVLLTGGGAYFALQTLAPPELTQMTKKTSEVPEGLKPKDPQENPAFQNQSGNAPAEKPNPALAAALGSGEAPPLAKDTGNPNTPSEVESGSGASKGLLAALAPSNHAVQLGTIMPVAYNINDIRVLSFSLEAEMSDAESAQVLREALPVFEKITITTVEQLMDKKFFNDILYVKEKLKKNLQNNFNKILEGEGRVKKITFTDFTVQ